MDSIDLVLSLPARQRAKIYAKALLRLLLPSMPWPVWMSICGFASIAAMAEGWSLLAPSLPALAPSDIVFGFGMMLPALALDALLRKKSPAQRSKLGYAAAPLLAAVTLCAWLALCGQPLALQQALAARAANVSARADALLADAEQLVAKDGAQSMASEALRVGLGRIHAKKVEPLVRPTLLPPLPMPSGAFALAPGAAREAAADAAQSEDFERSAHIATLLLSQQARGGKQALAALSRQALGIASELRRRPPPIAAGSAAASRELLLASMAAAWLAAPIAALVGAHGLAASLTAPFAWLWGALHAAALALARALRPAAARLIAPGEADLAELQRMVKAYSAAQDALADQDGLMGPPACGAEHLSVSLELSARSSAEAQKDGLERLAIAA